MAKIKTTEATTITISTLNKEIHAFEKTETYTLTSDLQITVLPNYIAHLYFESAPYNPIRIPTCNEKRIVKVAKIGKDKIGKKFYVIFNNPDIFTQNYPWGTGNIHLKYEGINFSMGAGGYFEIRIKDVNRYIATLGKNEAKAYSVEAVHQGIRDIINEQTAPVISQLIKESGTITLNNFFLMDELNIRLHNCFIESNYFDKYGVEPTSIYAVRILTNDINYNSPASRTAQSGGVRSTPRKTRTPVSPNPAPKPEGTRSESAAQGGDRTADTDNSAPSESADTPETR